MTALVVVLLVKTALRADRSVENHPVEEVALVADTLDTFNVVIVDEEIVVVASVTVPVAVREPVTREVAVATPMIDEPEVIEVNTGEEESVMVLPDHVKLEPREIRLDGVV